MNITKFQKKSKLLCVKTRLLEMLFISFTIDNAAGSVFRWMKIILL